MNVKQQLQQLNNQLDKNRHQLAAAGLVAVHPLTALGRKMAVTGITGFAPTRF